MNLFQYQRKSSEYLIGEVSDEPGWKEIRDTLASNCGMNAMPCIRVTEVAPDNILVLEHEWDGRELYLNYALETIKYIAQLWGGKVRLHTVVRSSSHVLESDGK